MNSIEDLIKACIILDLVNAPKMQFIFVKKEDFQHKYGFLIPNKTDGYFHWLALDKETGGRKIEIIATVETNGFSFNYIDPSQITTQKNI